MRRVWNSRELRDWVNEGRTPEKPKKAAPMQPPLPPVEEKVAAASSSSRPPPPTAPEVPLPQKGPAIVAAASASSTAQSLGARFDASSQYGSIVQETALAETRDALKTLLKRADELAEQMTALLAQRDADHQAFDKFAAAHQADMADLRAAREEREIATQDRSAHQERLLLVLNSLVEQQKAATSQLASMVQDLQRNVAEGKKKALHEADSQTVDASPNTAAASTVPPPPNNRRRSFWSKVTCCCGFRRSSSQGTHMEKLVMSDHI